MDDKIENVNKIILSYKYRYFKENNKKPSRYNIIRFINSNDALIDYCFNYCFDSIINLILRESKVKIKDLYIIMNTTDLKSFVKNNIKCFSFFSDPLLLLFEWDRTKQGFYFWQTIRNKVKDKLLKID